MRASNMGMFALARKTCVKEMSSIIFDHLPILEDKINYYFPSINEHRRFRLDS